MMDRESVSRGGWGGVGWGGGVALRGRSVSVWWGASEQLHTMCVSLLIEEKDIFIVETHFHNMTFEKRGQYELSVFCFLF